MLQQIFEKTVRFLTRAQYSVNSAWRRLQRKPRTVTEAPNLLPTLIKVLAAFTRVDGEMLEEEIDSILGFLRYDYPEVVYSELRQLFRQALEEQQDLAGIAMKLSSNLNNDRKILLGVQLYDLIFRSGMKEEQVTSYYDFMAKLGMADQAIDIVYQLNTNEEIDLTQTQDSSSQLEKLSFGDPSYYDVGLRDLHKEELLLAYRYQDFVILKNRTERAIIVQGRLLKPQEFCRIYPGQRILVGEQVITSQDLSFYFNAKKNVSLPHLFVAISKKEVRLDKARSRDSSLEVSFGLKVNVTALQHLHATLSGIPLKKGIHLQAQLDDRILFSNGGELNLNDLKRHVRSFGGRFPLKASKSEYLVSNNPGLLEENDILLSHGSGGEVLLKISCNYPERTGYIQVLQADRPIIVHDLPVRNGTTLVDGDTIGINPGQVLRCNFSDRIIEEERNIIHRMEVKDVLCRFSNNDVALDNLNFVVERGEMICVMGASGSGKSSLLRALAGDLQPVQGEVRLNDHSLYTQHETLRQYITYIPQYEAFDEQLTIEENLSFAAALRAPHLSRRERARRIDSKLAELGLNERRKNVVGNAHQKILSGGERKRLNIGLDMISTADVYLFDEPTSGLSSKDSEHVIEIIRGIAHNKIVLVTIHQPTSKLFEMFQKALLLDRGGKLVFFGTPSEMLAYFAEAEHEQLFGTELGGCKACGSTRPEFVFDVLETPLRDVSGDLIYQENNRGQLVPARRFSPDYWRDKFETHRLMKEVQHSLQSTKPLSTTLDAHPTPLIMPQWEPQRWRDEIAQLLILLQRSFISKLRNRSNLLTTLVEAPLLAFLIGAVLRYSESSNYDFSSAYHIPTYFFLSLVVAMFLGLTNSVDDIIRDRPVLLRERNLNIRLGFYVLAKASTLGVFAIAQCALFTLIGNGMLSIRGFFNMEFIAMFLTAFSGISLGLLISSLASEGKTAVNIIPIVLIPQIILGGALIKYEEMNRNLDFIYSLQQWFYHHPDSAIEPRSDLQVPFICEFMPMRWSYEALIYAQAKLNPLTIRQARIQNQINRITSIKHPRETELDRLEDLKELLAILSGLSAKTAAEIDHRLALIDQVIQGGPLDHKKIVSHHTGVSIEQLYTNQKMVDLVSKAEIEQADYRDSHHPNVFFGPVKYYLGLTIDILTFNIGVLLISTLSTFLALYYILKRQIKMRMH